MVSGADVQAKIIAGQTALQGANKTWPQMDKLYGTDWKNDWPKTSKNYIARSNFEAAAQEATQLTVASPVADFTVKAV